MRKRFRKSSKSIFSKMTLLFSIILISTVIFVAVFTSIRFVRIIREKEIALGDNTIKELSTYIQEKYNRVYSLSNYMNSGEISQVLCTITEDENAIYDIENIDVINTFFKGVTSADSDFCDIIIVAECDKSYSFTSKGNYEIDPSYSFMTDEKVVNFLTSDKNIHIFPNDPSEYCLKDRDPVISFMGKIYDSSLLPHKKIVGIYIMNIPQETLDVFFTNNKYAIITLQNKDNIVLYSTLKERIGKCNISENTRKGVYFSRKDLGTNGISILYELKKEGLYYELERLKIPLGIMIVLLVTITVMTVYSVGHVFRKRMIILLEYMKKVEGGDFKQRIQDDSQDEIGILSRSFNEMCSRIDSYIQKVYEAELQRKNAEINALQMQINPHFLYNTLESIKAKALEEGDNVTPEMIVLLGELFRWTSRVGDKFVTIEEDIEYVKIYLRLQSYRYEEALDINVTVEEENLDYAIPKLVLQPIIENVIMHGLSGIDRKGIVGIVVKKKMNNLEITIYDNGRGMEADDLNELRRKLESGNKPEQFSSIGIQNVHNRLQLLFGVEYGLQVSSQKSMGTVVKIVIPALSLEEMNQYVQVVDSR